VDVLKFCSLMPFASKQKRNIISSWSDAAVGLLNVLSLVLCCRVASLTVVHADWFQLYFYESIAVHNYYVIPLNRFPINCYLQVFVVLFADVTF